MNASVTSQQLFLAYSIFKLVYFFQIRSICFNLGQFGAGKKHSSQATSHRSLFYQYRKYPKHSLKLTLGLIRSKQKLLGLMSASVNS